MRNTFGVAKWLGIKGGPCQNDTLTVNSRLFSGCCPRDKTRRPVITRPAMSFSKVRPAVSAETCAPPDMCHTSGGEYPTRTTTVFAYSPLRSRRSQTRSAGANRRFSRRKEGENRGHVAKRSRLGPTDPGRILRSAPRA